MYKEKANQITQTIQQYFKGIFYGDIEKLRNTFSPEAYLYGNIKGAEYLKSLDDYLEGVQNRKSPHDLGEEFNMEILSIEVLDKIAIAKVHVPMLGFNYYDYLSFSTIDGEWKIVNKVFTHVE
jgi:hypothetical protein